MQINGSRNSTSFKGVIPIRVYIDGMETFNEKNIKSANRQLIKLLAGPTKDNEKAIRISRKLSLRDPDYDFQQAYYGLKLPEKWKKATPSDFFRLVKANDGKYYLFTGHQGMHIAKLGKQVGTEKNTAKLNNCPYSFDVYVAKRNYESFIKEATNNLKHRITEFFNKATNQKIGKPVEMDIFMESNKKYGKSTFKMQLSDINFSKE